VDSLSGLPGRDLGLTGGQRQHERRWNARSPTGVTRQHVLGLELVLIDGTIVRTGARVMKSSSGYDLTQLVVGSEGTSRW